MVAHAEGTFENQGWDEQTLVELDEGKTTRARVKQAFIGDIVGDGAVDWDMYYRPDGTAHFVGIYRLTGKLDGRSGTIVMQTTGEFDGKEAKGDWLVVGGTGELRNISGNGRFAAPLGPSGTYALDYEL
jgi:Protein of unknown function (DUF3224)